MKKFRAILRILLILTVFMLCTLTQVLKMYIKNNDVPDEPKKAEYQSVVDTQNTQGTKIETESKEE